MNKSTPIIVVVGVVVLALLGWWALKPMASTPSPASSNMVKQTKQSSTTTPPPASASSQTVVQKLLAENPGNPNDAQAVQTFSNDVFKAAIKTSTVDVTSCAPEPAVSQVAPGAKVTFKNSDTVPHQLFHGAGLNAKVPAQSSLDVTLPFTAGIYGYSCDNTINGIFFVTK